ncbi:MAG: class I SAM-dependent methyltransferase [Promethearchaeota archaeon]
MRFLKYISHTFHRNLLEKLLEKYKYIIKGEILDIGSKNRRYDFLFKGHITAIDKNPKPEFNIIKGDLLNLQFESNSFDSLICIEVFQYIEPENFKKGIEEIYRILKPEASAIISIPFYYKDHGDILRITSRYILNLLRNLNYFDVKVIKFGNKYTAIYDIIRYKKIEQQSSNKIKNLFYDLILFIFYIIIKILSLDKKNDSFYSGLFIILKKKNIIH